MEPHVSIVIPTYNRAHLIATAVEAALSQTYARKTVTVVDDGSTDDTRERLLPYLARPDFNCIRLARNVGTARAKNLGVALTPADAYTFHDSDDVPHRDKVLVQARVLAQPNVFADGCLNWSLAGRVPESRIQVGAVLSHHEILLPDGSRVVVERALSLVDDVFPNLQMGSGVPGDWTHINSGLFDAGVFERHGGFADCIEEDREFRNRLILGGEVIWVVPRVLLTKIETRDSLTQAGAIDYDSARRKADRRMVWDRVEAWRRGEPVVPVAIDLAGVAIDWIARPQLCALSSALMTPATRAWLGPGERIETPTAAHAWAVPSGLR